MIHEAIPHPQALAAAAAAGSGEPVRMSHLATAAQGEYAKIERPLSEADLRGRR